MKLGIAIQETWDFFHEINADLEAHHQTSLFERRVFDLPIFDTWIVQLFFTRGFRTLPSSQRCGVFRMGK